LKAITRMLGQNARSVEEHAIGKLGTLFHGRKTHQIARIGVNHPPVAYIRLGWLSALQNGQLQP